jgi:hypothetical protein
VEANLHRHGFHIIILGDFDVPGYDWVNGVPQVISYYYIEFRRDIIGNTASSFGLYQFNYAVLNYNFPGGSV